MDGDAWCLEWNFFWMVRIGVGLGGDRVANGEVGWV